MFFPNDSVSEIIAHFIGQFEVEVDHLRMRQSYEEFGRLSDLPGPPPDLPNIVVPFLQRLSLDPYEPHIPYSPDQASIPGSLSIVINPIELNEVALKPTQQSQPHHQAAPSYGAGAEVFDRLSEGPSSTSLQASQIVVLDDNDLVVIGEGISEIALVPHTFDPAPFLELVEQGRAIDAPLTDIETPHVVEDVPLFVNAAAEAIGAIAAGTPPAGATLFSGGDAEGTHVDGSNAELAPLLVEAMSLALRDAAGVEAPASIISITPDGTSGTIAVTAGANHLENLAAVVNAGVASTFIGVVGDVHQLDAIIQTNIYTDIDTLGALGSSGATSTSAHNIAQLIYEVRDGGAVMAAAHPDALPQNWTVSVIAGDVIFYSWTEQYNLVSDNDTHFLTATGTSVTVTSGENLASNTFTLADLGQMYDLIIVAGNVYDANLIVQTNILFDDDALSLLGGDTASTGGNLLWNEASIVNVGATDWRPGLPQSCSDSATALSAGDYRMPQSVRSDQSFEGYASLKVLYISGSLYDLHYVQQTNVLWDADSISVFETSLRAASDTEWTIGTGDNALVNVAKIVDYDTLGDTAFLGGQLYSDAILIQADLVRSGSDLVFDTSDTLVTEVIAFLDGDSELPFSDDSAVHLMHEGPSTDVMQSLLT